MTATNMNTFISDTSIMSQSESVLRRELLSLSASPGALLDVYSNWPFERFKSALEVHSMAWRLVGSRVKVLRAAEATWQWS